MDFCDKMTPIQADTEVSKTRTEFRKRPSECVKKSSRAVGHREESYSESWGFRATDCACNSICGFERAAAARDQCGNAAHSSNQRLVFSSALATSLTTKSPKSRHLECDILQSQRTPGAASIAEHCSLTARRTTAVTARSQCTPSLRCSTNNQLASFNHPGRKRMHADFLKMDLGNIWHIFMPLRTPTTLQMSLEGIRSSRRGRCLRNSHKVKPPRSHSSRLTCDGQRDPSR
ncbi:uncharacterized protein LAESUDRAFT_247003 [Laetiporus sulphureus 93-53]|uniref:Uncharacterized protein n=1 Tax=Laetiporus sulphureus 93-53 TaxID=1314785 RepID=A0A165DHX7_9APHY|nr:uncharacterized protein LAESUDRAFT_247003 [Laetiporus sulphureus 93-53]KZT04919.1 hypothetical protein LAESUDRAFT_247003 [Laetiporus sulphureus 93-53]